MNYPIKEQLGVNLDKYKKAKEEILDLAEKLKTCEDDIPGVLKASYYVHELSRTDVKWQDFVSCTPDWYLNILKEVSFEKGNSQGIKVKRAEVNCPYCGLTPLEDCPENLLHVKLSNYFCGTCHKFVIFTEKEFKDTSTKLLVTEDYILVIVRQ